MLRMRFTMMLMVMGLVATGCAGAAENIVENAIEDEGGLAT